MVALETGGGRSAPALVARPGDGGIAALVLLPRFSEIVTSSGFTVANGITLAVASGGTAGSVTVNNGGTLELFGGATATYTLNGGATLMV